MTARIVNLKTGQITPLQVIWSEEDDDRYYCDDCGATLTEEEVRSNIEAWIDRWFCDACNAEAAMRDWLNRSHEAQDRAVLRGWG